jgi:hypothetical protein
MKSHVRENMIKNFFASQMHFTPTDKGYRKVSFDEFANGLIEKQLSERNITLSDWRIYDDGKWCATVNETGHTVRGNSIYDVISNAILKEDDVDDI